MIEAVAVSMEVSRPMETQCFKEMITSRAHVKVWYRVTGYRSIGSKWPKSLLTNRSSMIK